MLSTPTVRWSLNIFLACMLFFFCAQTYLQFYPFKITEYKYYDVVNKSVEQGGILYVDIKYNKYRSIHAHVTRQLIDHLVIALPGEEVVNMPPGINQETIHGVMIPSNIPPGKYRLQSTATMELPTLFGIRLIQYRLVTSEFEILGN
jgi:hypothetical protein